MRKQGFESVDLNSILEKYAPSDKPLAFILPEGEVLTFKVPTRKSELDEFLQNAAAWYAKLPKWDSPEAKTHPFGEWLPRSTAEAIDAFMIAEFSVEPKFEQIHALKMLNSPWLVRDIVKSINEHSKTMDALWSKAALDEAKKNLKTSPGNGSGSKSVATASANTQHPSAKKSRRTSST